MHIVSSIKLPRSADVSSLYIQRSEDAFINYHEGNKEIIFCGVVLYPQIVILIQFTKIFIYTQIGSIYYFAP